MHSMKKFTSNLLFRICLAIALGISLGACIVPSSMGAPHAIVRFFNTFGALFDQLIKFIVPLIILGFVTPAIAETGRGAGQSPS